MKKLFLKFLFLCFPFTANSGYLDDWPNNDLCGWMESSSIPENIKKEVEKRKILCYGGVEVDYLPADHTLSSENGTIYPSPDPSIISQLESTYGLGDEQTMGSGY